MFYTLHDFTRYASLINSPISCKKLLKVSLRSLENTHLKTSKLLVNQLKWNGLLLHFPGISGEYDFIKTEPHEVYDRLHAYFHLGVCQGVRVRLHASNCQNWITDEVICFWYVGTRNWSICWQSFKSGLELVLLLLSFSFPVSALALLALLFPGLQKGYPLSFIHGNWFYSGKPLLSKVSLETKLLRVLLNIVLQECSWISSITQCEVTNDRNTISNEADVIVLDTKQRDTLCNITILFLFRKIVFVSRLTKDYLSGLCQE